MNARPGAGAGKATLSPVPQRTFEPVEQFLERHTIEPDVMRADPEINRAGRASPGHPRQVTEAERPPRRECRRPEALRRIGRIDPLERQAATPSAAAARRSRTPADAADASACPNLVQQPAGPIDLNRSSTCRCSPGRSRRARAHSRPAAERAGLRSPGAARWRRACRQARTRSTTRSTAPMRRRFVTGGSHSSAKCASGSLARNAWSARAVLNWKASLPGGTAEPASGTRSPNAESANRVDSDRRRMPTVRRQPSGGRRSPAAIMAFPASTDAAAVMVAPEAHQHFSAGETLLQAEPIIIARSAHG